MLRCNACIKSQGAAGQLDSALFRIGFHEEIGGSSSCGDVPPPDIPKGDFEVSKIGHGGLRNAIHPEQLQDSALVPKINWNLIYLTTRKKERKKKLRSFNAAPFLKY